MDPSNRVVAWLFLQGDKVSEESFCAPTGTARAAIRAVNKRNMIDVLRMVVGNGLRLALFGTAAGAVGALISTRVLGRLLYDVTPTDPLTFLTVTVTLILVALAAVAVPALRAARTDPMTVLRSE